MAQDLGLAQDLQLVREWYENKTTVTEMIHWVNGRLKKWEEDVVGQFPEKAKILDVGCGLGREAFALYQWGFSLTGIDTSHEVIKQVTGMAKINGYPIQFSWYDGQTLPFESGSFDAVIIWAQTFGLMYGGDYNAFLKECARVLKSGGFLSFSSHDYEYASEIYPQYTDGRKFYPYADTKLYWELFLPGELRAFAENAGFVVTECARGEVYRPEDGVILHCLCRKP